MKKFLLLLSALGAFIRSQAQISIGSTKVDTNAILTLASETKGLLLPRLSMGARDVLSSSRSLASGMFIYNTTSQELNFYNGSQWISFEANGDMGNFSSYRHSIMVSFDAEKATAFYTDNAGVGHFAEQQLDTGLITSVSSKHQVLLHNGRTAWVFNVNYAGMGAWTSHPLAGAASSLADDDLIVLYRNGTAYGLSQDSTGNAVWMPQTTGNGDLSAIASKKQIVLYRNGGAFGFSRSASGLCAWSRTSIVGKITISKAAYNQVLLANDNNVYMFTGDVKGGGVWYNTTLSGAPGIISTQD